MEPNQELNMQTNSMNQTYSNIGSANIDTAGQSNMNSGRPSNDIVFQDTSSKKNGKTGIILGFVFLTLIAAGGVGFGVWAMMDGNTQKEQLQSEIKALKAQINSLSEQLEEAEDNNEGENIQSEDYVYVKDWGYKIKKIDGITITGQVLKKSESSTYQNSSGTWNSPVDTLLLWGMKSDKGQDASVPPYADSSKNGSGLIWIERHNKGDAIRPESAPVLLFSDDNYDYYYDIASAPFATDETEVNEESEVKELLRTMLTNLDNFSTI